MCMCESTQISTTIETTVSEQESLPVSGGYLAKPTQIYAVEEVKQQVQNSVNVIEEEIKTPINLQSSFSFFKKFFFFFVQFIF